MAMVVSVAFAMTALAGPARADHVEEGLGMLLGGIVGGSVGSAIGKGNGRKIAIGVGSVLGALYGGEVATHHRQSRRAGHHVRPPYSQAPLVVKYSHQPVPIHVQPVPIHVQPVPIHVQPVPIHVQPARIHVVSPSAMETSITLSSRGGSTSYRHEPAAITECRLLEGGLSPVYGCRDVHGNWRILR